MVSDIFSFEILADFKSKIPKYVVYWLGVYEVSEKFQSALLTLIQHRIIAPYVYIDLFRLTKDPLLCHSLPEANIEYGSPPPASLMVFLYPACLTCANREDLLSLP